MGGRLDKYLLVVVVEGWSASNIDKKTNLMYHVTIKERSLKVSFK